MVEWVGRNRRVVAVAAAVAFALVLLVSYGFSRWWPGCHNFNTELQQSLTLERAQAVTDRCSDVSASDVQEVMVVDTIFPVLYATFLAGLLLLVGSAPLLRGRGRWAATWFARAAVVGALLDISLENGSLVLVTLEGWPPSAVGMTETLLLVAGIAAWTKWVLLVSSFVALVVLVLILAKRFLQGPEEGDVTGA